MLIEWMESKSNVLYSTKMIYKSNAIFEMRMTEIHMKIINFTKITIHCGWQFKSNQQKIMARSLVYAYTSGKRLFKWC